MGKKTSAKLPDGTVMNWSDLCDKYHVDRVEGGSAHRDWDSAAFKNNKLPKVEVVFSEDVSDDKIVDTKKSINSKDVQAPKRKAIDVSIKRNVWYRYWGRVVDAQCYVCGNPLALDNVEIGHIIALAEGGSDSIENLAPICRGCNLGMGTENLIEYKSRIYSNVTVNSLVQPVNPIIVLTKEQVIEKLKEYSQACKDNRYLKRAIELLQEKK